jgi:O-antigen/teichoic acid export membrane protein
MASISKLPRNLLAVYAANGLNGLVSVLAIPVAVKFLGLSGYGLLSFYVLMSSYIALADFGIGKNLLRLLAASTRDASDQRHLRVAAGLYLLLCCGWAALAPLLVLLVPRWVFPVPPEYVVGLRWMVLLSLAEFVLGIPASLMQTSCAAKQRFGSYSVYSLLSGLLRNAAMIGGTLAFHSAVGVAAVLALRKLVELFLASRVLGRLPAAAWRPVFEWRSFRTMLSQSVTLSTAQVLMSTLMGSGSLLVNAAFGLQAAGIYRAAFDLAGKIAFLSNGVTLVVFPKAAQYFGSRPIEGSGVLFGALLRASSLLYAFFGAAMVLAGPVVLQAMGLNSPFTVKLFLLLAVALSLNAHALIGNELIQAAGRYGRSIWFSGSALVTLIVLFTALRGGQGVVAIGWAWIGAALMSAIIADGLLLQLCGAESAEQATTALTKLAAVAACLCLAAPHFSGISTSAAAIDALLWGTGAAVMTARGLTPLARTWLKEPQRAAIEKGPAVWA